MCVCMCEASRFLHHIPLEGSVGVGGGENHIPSHSGEKNSTQNTQRCVTSASTSGGKHFCGQWATAVGSSSSRTVFFFFFFFFWLFHEPARNGKDCNCQIIHVVVFHISGKTHKNRLSSASRPQSPVAGMRPIAVFPTTLIYSPVSLRTFRERGKTDSLSL